MRIIAPAALMLDAAFGEPPARLHPTVWMGWAAGAFDRLGNRAKSRNDRRLAGLCAAVAVPGAAYALTAAALRPCPPPLRTLAEAAIVSLTISMRGLARGANAVDEAIRRGDLPTARSRAAEIVGRDTGELNEVDLARAAVESVAENTSDGVAAPMLYGALWGAPGAMAYRAVNTLDSMLGYRRGLYEDLGLAPARLDDVANLLPARITALVTVAVSGCPVRTASITLRDGSLHPSPNAGRVEAAFAGALGISLGGESHYAGEPREGETIGDGRGAETADVSRAIRLMRRVCVALALALAVAPKLPWRVDRG